MALSLNFSSAVSRDRSQLQLLAAWPVSRGGTTPWCARGRWRIKGEGEEEEKEEEIERGEGNEIVEKNVR